MGAECAVAGLATLGGAVALALLGGGEEGEGDGDRGKGGGGRAQAKEFLFSTKESGPNLGSVGSGTNGRVMEASLRGKVTGVRGCSTSS